jgi:predicted HTH domain antitoxin
MIKADTLKTVMIIEFVSDLKKFIFSIACSKLSQDIDLGQASGLAKMSIFGFRALTKTKRNGKKYAVERTKPDAKIVFLAIELPPGIFGVFNSAPPCAC